MENLNNTHLLSLIQHNQTAIEMNIIEIENLKKEVSQCLKQLKDLKEEKKKSIKTLLNSSKA